MFTNFSCCCFQQPSQLFSISICTRLLKMGSIYLQLAIPAIFNNVAFTVIPYSCSRLPRVRIHILVLRDSRDCKILKCEDLEPLQIYGNWPLKIKFVIFTTRNPGKINRFIMKLIWHVYGMLVEFWKRDRVTYSEWSASRYFSSLVTKFWNDKYKIF